MYADVIESGDVRCVSLRSVASFAMASFAVWFVSHPCGMPPAGCTRGRCCSDTSSVLSGRLGDERASELRAWVRVAFFAGMCRALRICVSSRIHASAAWSMLRTCFQVKLGGPRDPPRARTIGMARGSDTGMTGVVLRSSAILTFARQTLRSAAATSTSSRLWACVARRSDSGSLKRVGLCSPHAATERTIAWYVDGPGQHLTMRPAVHPPVEARAPRPCALEAMLRGCTAFSSRKSQEPRAQQSLTSPPALHGQATLAPGGWAPAGGGAADQTCGAKEESIRELSGCSGGPRQAWASEKDRSDAAFGAACAASGPLLAVRLVRGAGASCAAPCEALPRGAASLC